VVVDMDPAADTVLFWAGKKSANRSKTPHSTPPATTTKEAR